MGLDCCCVGEGEAVENGFKGCGHTFQYNVVAVCRSNNGVVEAMVWIFKLHNKMWWLLHSDSAHSDILIY